MTRTEEMMNSTVVVEKTLTKYALQYMGGLYGYALTLTGNRTEAEDLVQETYVRALRALDRSRPENSLKSWLFTILRNIHLNQVRKSKIRRLTTDYDTEQGSLFDLADSLSKDPLASYCDMRRKSDVRKAVQSLPPIYREAIILREYEDLSYTEIGQVLGLPAGTVMSRLCRARGKLRELLQHWDPLPTNSLPGKPRIHELVG
jgi:RNA polymerase sigma-70 factor, ECF subfamily